MGDDSIRALDLAYFALECHKDGTVLDVGPALYT
jgi:hypothetical protein